MLRNPSLLARLFVYVAVSGVLLFAVTQYKVGQQARGQESQPGDAAGPTPYAGEDTPAPASEPATPPRPANTGPEAINYLTLMFQGGIFMIPLAGFSVLVVTFTIERAIGLRRSRIMPPEFVSGLGRLSNASGFDPRRIYRLCQEHPSAASNVIRSMLLKVGRPHSEVEQAVKETSQREADKLYSNVRYLTMSAAVAPLIGLLGTVQGMIIAFHDTTQLAPGQNKADFLAEGIYIALVTTFGGLCVAIPAAVAAHFYEGRIQGYFRDIDEMMFNLLPQVERYEGRIRFGKQLAENEETSEPVAPPMETRRPATATS